jgi:hypothetical protein
MLDPFTPNALVCLKRVSNGDYSEQGSECPASTFELLVVFMLHKSTKGHYFGVSQEVVFSARVLAVGPPVLQFSIYKVFVQHVPVECSQFFVTADILLRASFSRLPGLIAVSSHPIRSRETERQKSITEIATF